MNPFDILGSLMNGRMGPSAGRLERTFGNEGFGGPGGMFGGGPGGMPRALQAACRAVVPAACSVVVPAVVPEACRVPFSICWGRWRAPC